MSLSSVSSSCLNGFFFPPFFSFRHCFAVIEVLDKDELNCLWEKRENTYFLLVPASRNAWWDNISASAFVRLYLVHLLILLCHFQNNNIKTPWYTFSSQNFHKNSLISLLITEVTVDIDTAITTKTKTINYYYLHIKVVQKVHTVPLFFLLYLLLNQKISEQHLKKNNMSIWTLEINFLMASSSLGLDINGLCRFSGNDLSLASGLLF